MTFTMKPGLLKSLLLTATISLLVSFHCSTLFSQSLKPAYYVPPACQGKPITTVPRDEMLARKTTVRKPDPTISQTDQRKVFDDLVSVVEANYLYPDYNGQNWPALVAEYRAKVETGLNTEQFYTEMANLTRRLGDRHSYFQSPEMVAEQLRTLTGSNTYAGIGVLSVPLIEKKIVSVLSVYADSPAERNGIRVHDAILAVDGFPLVENNNVYNSRVRGPECSLAVFTIRSPGEKPRDIGIVRFRISGPQPVFAQLITTKDGSRIGYIFVPTFLDLTIPEQTRKALEGFGKFDGLIIDQRMNAGGSSKVLEPMLGFFMSGAAGNFVSRSGLRPLNITGTRVNNSQTVPLIVLTGNRTISYAEVFAGILQDIGRAKVVGQTSRGNVETLHSHKFHDGSILWLAQESFRSPRTGTSWETQGVKPDVEAYADWDTFTFDNDPAVAAALKLLVKK